MRYITFLLLFSFYGVRSKPVPLVGKHIVISQKGNVLIPCNTTEISDSVRSPIKIEVFFTHDGNIREKIISFIDEEMEKITMAAFIVTDKTITASLIRAKERGVDVELIADGKQAESAFSKITMLAQKGIPVWCYYPPKNSSKKNKSPYESNSIMHNKYTIFHGTERVVTGSLNLTAAACNHNCENICSIQNDATVVARYVEGSEKIKKHCTLHVSKNR